MRHWHVFSHVGGFGCLPEYISTHDEFDAAFEEFKSLIEEHYELERECLHEYYGKEIEETEIVPTNPKEIRSAGGILWSCPWRETCLFSIELTDCDNPECELEGGE